MKRILLNKGKIYVMTPSDFVSGGPELLHQLVCQLIELGYEAYTYYHPIQKSSSVKNSVSSLNSIYNNPIVTSIEDNENNLIIVPEIYYYMKQSYDYKNIQKVLWWLSIDNYFLNRSRYVFPDKIIHFACRQINKVVNKDSKIDITSLSMQFHRNRKLLTDKFVQQFHYHFVQSVYAQTTLLEQGFSSDNIFYLSDYLNDIYLGIDSYMEINNKTDIVLYNPAKGYNFTKQLIRQSHNIDFIPIKGLSNEEVLFLLKKAKVYIDFGNHPGKDRMPREAAMAGCCIITGLNGSAKNAFDVEIPQAYKFETRATDIEQIIGKINECFSNYLENYKKFESYRQKIKAEKNRFVMDIKSIFNVLEQADSDRK